MVIVNEIPRIKEEYEGTSKRNMAYTIFNITYAMHEIKTQDNHLIHINEMLLDRNFSK